MAQYIDGIHWEEWGIGEPVLLFVHGFCCDLTDWSAVIIRLSDRFRCVALDLPGHGKSPGRVATMEAIGAAINRVKQACGSDQVIVIGHSLGAKMVREAFRQSSERIAGIILVDGSLYVSDLETMRQNARNAVSDGMGKFLEALCERMCDKAARPEEFSRTLRRSLDRDLEFAKGLFLDSVEWDAAHAVPTIRNLTVPAMVIQATTFDSEFRWQPLPAGGSTPLIDEMRRSLADFDVVIVPGVGHFVMSEAPGETAEAIASFASHVAKQRSRNLAAG